MKKLLIMIFIISIIDIVLLIISFWSSKQQIMYLFLAAICCNLSIVGPALKIFHDEEKKGTH